ncbi:MAG: penicillin-binding protein 2 [Acidobacteria bacterium]|nr:penicillin-binding protein 2 [Acidobacteriota bacterium]
MKPLVRLAGLGMFFTALFAILLIRLWTIQVTLADEYVAEAQSLQVRLVSTPAPRGEIRDINGKLLAGSRSALALVIDGALIDPETEADLVQRLAALSDFSASEVQARIDQAKRLADRVTLVDDISDATALFVAEHSDEFGGIFVEPQPVREYPLGELVSSVVGYIGKPNADDLEDSALRSTDVLGKAGTERFYDDDLRGTPGFIKYRVDAQRNVLEILGEQTPQPGDTMILNIETELQQVVFDSLEQGLDLSRQLSSAGANCVPSDTNTRCPVRATAVVLDVRTGAVKAMVSVPTFDSTIFIEGVSQQEWDRLTSLRAFSNYAIQGVYAPASTFKTVAYVTALEGGFYPTNNTATSHYNCTGLLTFKFNDGSPQVFNDWKPAGHGPLDLSGALQQSCDVYFWEVALTLWRDGGEEVDARNELQRWAREFGYDERSGIDLPFEAKGLIPDEAWFKKAQEETPGRVREGPWTGGDLMNTVIGQGSTLATPLQIANAYAAMVNGGTLWQPQVLNHMVDSSGVTVLENPRTIIRRIDMAESTTKALLDDMRLVVNGNRGTARGAFANFGPNKNEVGGKTGTAEVIKGEDDVDTALFVGVTPVSNPEYVVVVVIERGGSGGRIAAPTGRRILQYLVNGIDAVTPVREGDDLD